MAADPNRRLARALKRVYQQLDVYRVEALQVNPRELAILSYIDDHGQCRLKDITAALGLPVSTVSWTVNKMVNSDYLERTQDPTDRRAIILELGKAGRETIARNDEVYDRIVQLVAGSVSTEGFGDIMSMVERMAAAE